MYTYNNVTLQYCKTLFFEVTTERDPTNTDVLWRKYTVRVRGFLATSQGSFPSDTAATLQEVKAALTTPRRSFSYSIGNKVLVEVPAGAGPVLDAALGPEPLPVTINEVTAGVFLVEHGVICRVIDCPPNCEDKLDPVVSLRWEQSETFDTNWASTIETHGMVIVRSDLLQSADSFRELATPPVLPNYQRTRSHYVLSPDGTRLQFSFTDVEQDRLPPYPATTARGRFTVNSNKGGVRIGQVDLELRGQPGTSRGVLLIVALRMALSKLSSEGFASLPPVTWGSVSEDLFEPSVSVSIQGMLSPAGYDAAGAAVARTIPGTTVPAPGVLISVDKLEGYTSDKASPGIAPPVRKRLLGLLAAAFRDPCACQQTMKTVELRSDPAGPGTSGGPLPKATVEIRTLPDVSPLPGMAPTVSDKAPYDHYEIETTLDWDEGYVHLPAPKPGSRAAVVRATGPRMQMLACWAAVRTGVAPVLPAYHPQNPNFIPLGGAIVAKNIDPDAYGAKLTHGVSGWYRYAIIDPSKVNVTAPVPPFLAELATEAAQNTGGFWSNLLWKFIGNRNNNPFIENGVSLDEAPVPDIPANLSGALDQVTAASWSGLGGFQDLSQVDRP